MLDRCPATRRRTARSRWRMRHWRASTSRPPWRTCPPRCGASPRPANAGPQPWPASGSATCSSTSWATSTAGTTWFVRARRLIEDEPPCLEQGWVAVAAMGCDVDDPAELLAAAELALDRARRFGDVNLETKALADAGLAHVQAGRVGRGHGAARRGDGAGLRARRRHRDGGQVGVLVLHRLLLRRRLRAGRLVDRPAPPARPDRPGAGRPGVPLEPLRQRAGDAARGAGPVGRGRGGARPGQGRSSRPRCRHRAGTPTSPSPTCASARAGSPTPRCCCSARTKRMQALLPGGPPAPGPRRPRPGPSGCSPRPAGRSATTGCGRSSCSPCWSMPSWRRATSTAAPRRAATSWPSALDGARRPRRSRRAGAAARARVLAADRRRRGAGHRGARADRRPASTAGSCRGCAPRLLIDLARLRERAGDGAAATLDAKAAAAILATLDVVLPARRRAARAARPAMRRASRPARGRRPTLARDGQVVGGIVSTGRASAWPTRRACATSPS